MNDGEISGSFYRDDYISITGSTRRGTRYGQPRFSLTLEYDEAKALQRQLDRAIRDYEEAQ